MRQAAKNSSLAGVLPAQANVLEIKPCILVLDKIKVDRAVSYEREDLGVVTHSDGSEDAEWKTLRHYRCREEAKEASNLYGRARTKLQTVCVKTDIGFVCPKARLSELTQAISEARQMVDEANQRFQHCHVSFRVVCTELQPTNIEGSLTLRDALVEQTTEIKNALKEFDAHKARKLLSGAKNFTDVLADPTTQDSLKRVHDEARELAKEIVRVVKECGNVADAVCTMQGQQILHRAKAPWSIF